MRCNWAGLLPGRGEMPMRNGRETGRDDRSGAKDLGGGGVGGEDGLGEGSG
jgi:hypothetical protein